MYSRVLAKWLESGIFAIDTPIAPSLVGQSVMAWPVARLFGFSYLTLRLYTLALAALGLWAIDRILRIADVPASLRLAALLTLGMNPLYFYFGASYMTELYGYVPALIGAVLWLGERRRCGDAGTVARPWLAVACGALIGATFWTRQYCALVFPALLGATGLPLLFRRDWQRIRASLPAVLAGGAVWGAIVLAYFPWALTTGNYNQFFHYPLAKMRHLAPSAWLLQPGICLTYVSACLAPLLVLLPWPKGQRRPLLGAALGLAAATALTKWGAHVMGLNDFGANTWLHTRWPFLHNVIFNAGLGPVTLSDTYHPANQVWPRISGAAWTPVEALVLMLPLLWAPLVANLPRLLRERGVRTETLLFGLLLSVGSLAVVIQAFQNQVFDRYHLSAMLGLVLVLAVAPGELAPARSPRAGQWAAFAASFLAMAAFSTAALHDHFRWQDVRWQLAREALRQGISPANLQAGFEVNGVLAMDLIVAGKPPAWCHNHRCQCTDGWYCLDDSFRVSMNELPGYEVIESVKPDYWLVEGPPLLFSRRTEP
jgi:hypothetical protein